jgi:predicted transcriptional regulator
MNIESQKMYTARDAADFLGVSEETVKNYLRGKRLVGKQIGPKKRWYVKGSAILKLRTEWGVDEIED